MTKICTTCGKEKDIDAFRKHPHAKFKRQDSCKICQNEASTQRYLRLHRELKKSVFEKLGKVCKRCGFSDERAIQIDHVNGDGKKERKIIQNNRIAFLRKVLADVEGRYQLLCSNCNWIKRYEAKEVKILQTLN